MHVEADGGDIRYAEHGDAHLAYRTWGSGPPLLYVTSQFVPIVAMDEEPTYQRFLTGLARFATVIAFDRQGIGSSDPMSATPTVEDWADQLVSVLDASGYDSAYLLAHAWGALAAVKLAATRPERVRGLVLAMAAGRAEAPQGASLEQVVETARPGSDAGGVVDILRLIAPTRADDVGFRRWWDTVGQRGASPAVAKQLLTLQITANVSDLAPSVHVPTLVIDRPGATRPFAGAPFGTDIEGARVVEVGGIDLLVWLPDSEAVIAEVEDFITGTRQRGPLDRRLCAVMFTDVVGSTNAAARLGDRRWRDVLESHDRILRAALAGHGGREIDSAGDGFLATFDTPSDAARCAARVHKGMAAIGIELRIGIHCGEVEVREDNIAGLGVHLAARVQAAAAPGETWVTSTVREAMLGADLQCTPKGEHDLKGVPGRWSLYAIEP